jgi:PAS domain S-box-containing protein
MLPSASLFEALLDAAPDAIVIVDARGEIVLVNAQVETLFGYRREELLGSQVEVLVPERHHPVHGSHRARYHEAPHVRPMGVELELFAQRKDGTEFPVEISLSPLETAEGTLVSAAIRDVTERRAVQRQLQETNIELQAANAAKDVFLRNMSHELRTPLNGIIGFTGTMLMGLAGDLNGEQREQLEIVQRNAQHLLSLINDLLDIARIESGTIELAPEEVSARAVVEEAAASLRPPADAKGLELVVDASDDCLLTTDRRALSQILLNLGGNAVKFTTEGEVRLSVRQERIGDEHLTTFAVADTGIGIGIVDQKRLFEPFAQASADAGEGAGLGLAISARLAELVDAELTVESESGRGSRFEVVFRQGA